MRYINFFVVLSGIRSFAAKVGYERSSRSALSHGLTTSKNRRRPFVSHSAQRRRSARRTIVAAHAASKSRSAGQEVRASEARLNCEGASAIQASHTMKLMPSRSFGAFFLL